MTLNQWIATGEVGVSSKTMWAAITRSGSSDRKTRNWDVPHDPDDFSRCISFVRECSITPEQLQMVKSSFKWWAPIIDNWDELVSLWDEESPNGKCPKLYNKLRDYKNEVMVLSGFKEVHPGSWILQD